MTSHFVLLLLLMLTSLGAMIAAQQWHQITDDTAR
jgi:hypothetical protein